MVPGLRFGEVMESRPIRDESGFKLPCVCSVLKFDLETPLACLNQRIDAQSCTRQFCISEDRNGAIKVRSGYELCNCCRLLVYETSQSIVVFWTRSFA